MLEAGDEEPEITSIPGFMTQLPESNLTWKFKAEMEKDDHVLNGKIDWPSGKVRRAKHDLIIKNDNFFPYSNILILFRYFNFILIS